MAGLLPDPRTDDPLLADPLAAIIEQMPILATLEVEGQEEVELVAEDGEGIATPRIVREAPPSLDYGTRRDCAEALAAVRRLAAAMEARQAAAAQAEQSGDVEARRTALEEAAVLGYEIRDLWNEVILVMPANAAFDEEQTAAHHFPGEADVVAAAIARLAEIRGALRR